LKIDFNNLDKNKLNQYNAILSNLRHKIKFYLEKNEYTLLNSLNLLYDMAYFDPKSSINKYVLNILYNWWLF